MPRRLSFTRLVPAQQPLLFIALAFIGGLLLAAYKPVALRYWMTTAIVLWLSAALCLLLRCGGWLVVGWLLLSCAVSGGALWTLNEMSVGENRVRSLFARGELLSEEPIEIWGTLDAAPELAPERIYLSLTVERVATLQREQPARGAVQIVVPFNDYQARVEYDQLALDYGARVRLLGFLSNRSGYRNPGAPEFDELLEHRGYDASGWVKSPLLIERLGAGQRQPVLAWLYQVRARAVSVTLRHFRQPTSGLLVAALFGNRHFIGRDTAELFRAGGTFHLLVISGLHVALLAGVALWLTRRLRLARWLEFALVTVLMWAYALMVGAQPSITRAVVMLNIALAGQLLFRAALGANTLAAAALVLLAWQPRDLFNPGFQLSFLTVLMIVVVAAPLYQRLEQIGAWQPSATTPYPPRVPRAVQWSAETLFWDEQKFRQEMNEALIHYRLDKAGVARWLNGWRWQRALAWIVVTLFTTTVVQIGLLPLMLAHFHRVAIIAPLANVIEGALVFALMMAGAGYLLIYAVVGSWASLLTETVNWLGWLTVKAGEPLLAWRRASWRVPDFGAGQEWIFLGYFLAVLLLIILINEWNPFRRGDEDDAARRRFGGRLAALTASLALVVLGWLLIVHPFAPAYEHGRLSITFLDVGQGDAMLLSFPQGRLMLLDSGGRIAFDRPDETGENEDIFIEDRIGIGEAAVLPYLWKRGVKQLDWIVASHGDADHAAGFAEITHSLTVNEAMRGATVRRNPSPDLFDQTVHAAGMPLRIVKRGDEWEIDGVRLTVLSPFAEGLGAPISDNNESLVLRLTFGQRSFLFTGDIEKEAEARLVASASELRADVLKVAHHGSQTSSTVEFLKRVQPQHAVISVAYPSPFGHPHAEAMTRLSVTGARLWQTSQCGAITISTDGQDLRVETFVKCE